MFHLGTVGLFNRNAQTDADGTHPIYPIVEKIHGSVAVAEFGGLMLNRFHRKTHLGGHPRA